MHSDPFDDSTAGTRTATFGDFLVAQGIIHAEGLRQARDAQHAMGGRLDTVLLDLDLTTEAVLLEALGKYHATRTVSADELGRIPADAANMISPRMARRLERVIEIIDFGYYHIAPHPEKDERLTVYRCTHDSPELPARVRCQYCKDPDEDIAKRVFGGHKIWGMNKTMWGQIWSLNSKLSKICVFEVDEGVLCGGEVVDVAYVCEECGLELKVVKECTEHEAEEACACETESGFVCCSGSLTLKEE